MIFSYDNFSKQRKTNLVMDYNNTFSGIFIFTVTILGYLPSMAHFVNLITFYGYYYIFKSYKSNANINYISDFLAELEEIISAALATIGKLLF